MAGKKIKKSDMSKNLRDLAENEYLKKLERAIIGKSGDDIYLKRGENRLNQRPEDIIDVWDKIEPVPPAAKKTPSIPIEWALGEDKDHKNNVEPPIAPNSVPIEQAIPDSNIVRSEKPSSAPTSPRAVENTLPEPKAPPEIKVAPVKETPPSPPPSLVKSLYDNGTIIRLEDGSVGVYKGPIPGKEYHLIYNLRPDGNISPEGVCLYAYRSDPLGRISEDAWKEMLRSMRWKRDRIIEHLSSQEKKRLIPLLSPKAIRKEVAENSKKRISLERGRSIRIGFGDRIWDAVYWGADELGQIVAHDTNKKWTLMHLNLGRFGDSLEYGELLSPEELKDINASLTESLSLGD